MSNHEQFSKPNNTRKENLDIWPQKQQTRTLTHFLITLSLKVLEPEENINIVFDLQYFLQLWRVPIFGWLSVYFHSEFLLYNNKRWNPWKATKACIKDPLINIFQNSISVCNISVSIIIHQNKKKTYIQKISCLKKFVLQKIRFQKKLILIPFDKDFGIKHVNKDLVLKDWSSNKYVDLKFFVPKNILTSFLAGIF